MFRAVGTRIKKDGNNFQIFGVNVLGMEGSTRAVGGLWTGLSIAEFLGAIKARGFNTCRFPMHPEVLQGVPVDPGIVATWYAPNAYLAGKNSLQLLDEWVKECEKIGMNYIFEFRHTEGGVLSPLWYTTSYSRTQWLSDIQFLANRYKTRPGFIGIDTKHVPSVTNANWGSGNIAQDWQMAVEDAYEAINAVNTNILLFIQWLDSSAAHGIEELTSDPPTIPANRIVYTAILHGPDVNGDTGEGLGDGGFPGNMPAIWDRMFGDEAASRPILVAEVGGQYGYGSTKDVPWENTLVSYLISKGIGDFIAYSWGENGGTNMGILADTGWRYFRTDKMDLLLTLKSADSTFTAVILAPPHPTEPTVYRVDGRKVTHNGHEIQLFGVNVIGMELMDATVGGLWTGKTIPEYLGLIKAQKFNVIRFPIGPRTIAGVAVDGGLIATWLPANAYMSGWNSLQVLDEWIKRCEAIGMRYIFDIHYLNPDGSIPDLWYTPDYSEADWLSDIQFLADRYKGQPGFVGIDLKNEPKDNTATYGDGNAATDWKIAIEKAWGVIASTNTDILVIVEPLGLHPGIGQQYANPPAVPNDRLLLSVHIYGPDVWWDFGEGFLDPSFPNNMFPIWDSIFGNVGQEKSVYVGEWGGQFGDAHPLDDDWQIKFVDYLLSRDIKNFTYWGWGPNAGPETKGIVGDDFTTVHEAKMENILRLWTNKASYSNQTMEGVTPPSEQGPTLYRVSQNRIYHNGHKLQIFGVNVIGMELPEAVVHGLWVGQSIPEFLQKIKGLSFNTIRFPIGPRVLQGVEVDPGFTATWYTPNTYLEGKNSLQLLDEWIKECEKLGLRYIFDMHYLEDGSIPDLWYTDEYPEEQWLDDITFVAERYAGNLGFIGIDIKNEPNGNTATWGDNNPATDWKIAAEKAFVAINSVNSDILIIVEWLGTSEGISQMTDDPPNIPANRISYSAHVYGPSVWWDFGEGFLDPTFPANMPPIWDRMFGIDGQTKNVYLGEIGGKYLASDNNDKGFQDELINFMDRRGIRDFTWWGWGNTSGGDTGGILADDGFMNVRQDKVDLLMRIHTPEATYSYETAAVYEPTPFIRRRTIVDYKALLIKLLPRGRAWQIAPNSLMDKIFEAIANELARVQDDIDLIEKEADPRYTTQLLPDWEGEYGLPDECSVLAPTIPERRFALIRKIVHEGGQSEEFFQDLVSPGASALTITYGTTTTLPAVLPTPIKGMGFKHIWYVNVPDDLEEWFEADDPADTLINELIDPAYIQCLILKYKPAHTLVVFV